MAITITKQKPVEKAPLPKVETETYVDPAELTLEQLADKYGELEDRLNALKANPVFAQFDEVAKQLAVRIKETMEPTDTAVIKGTKWLVEVGVAAKAPAKPVPGGIALLRKILGNETFDAIAKVNVTDITKYCTPEQAAQVLDPEPGYTERRKIVAKHIG